MPVYQEVTILFSLTRWMETLRVRKYFMRYFNCAHKLNSQFWMENPACDSARMWAAHLLVEMD